VDGLSSPKIEKLDYKNLRRTTAIKSATKPPKYKAKRGYQLKK
jgi:hypothetical protein